MPLEDPIQALQAICRRFGREAAARKHALLDEIEALDAIPVEDLLLLHDTLDFLRAYPDDARLRRRVERMGSGLRRYVPGLRGGADAPRLRDTGFPGAINRYPYAYQVLRRLARRFPTCLEIDWEAFEADETLAAMIELLLTPAENEGMEDLTSGWHDWIQTCKSSPSESDLEFLLRLFERSDLGELQQANLYESCVLPLRYELKEPGSARCEVEFPGTRVHYQRSDIPRDRFALEPEIRRPIEHVAPLSPNVAEDVIGRCLAALCSRNLEIYPLIWASPRDVTIYECERGIRIVLVGVPSRHRLLLGSMYLFLVIKNGVPIAYGPASPFAGCCEMGINLFPEFRGGEIRYVFSQVMRILHHVLGVEYFYLTPYGMGVGNEDAIRTGAFWFYRNMGFRCTNPRVEDLAREEEERMRRERGHRSSTRTLRRLSRTGAFLDLSEGRCRPLRFGDLGQLVSRFVAREFDGDRRLAYRACTTRVRRALGIRSLRVWTEAERMLLERLSLILALIPDLGTWRPTEKRALVAIVRAKAARSEARAARLLARHSRLETALRTLLAEL